MSAIDPRTPEGVAKIAHLSRLALGEEEARALGEHMVRILEWVDTLRELETEGVSPALHDDASDVRREDVVVPSLPVEEALANGPRKNEHGFLVPAVLSE